MTQKKSIASKLLLAAIALTLISFCFLGSTFARYTSGNKGSASLNVAEWDVAYDIEADTNAVFGSLSPNKTAYGGGNSYVEANKREKSTGKVLVATITNSGDVDALVTVSAAASPSLWNGESEASFGDGYTKEAIQGLFSIKLYKGNSDSDTSTTTALKSEENVTANDGKLYIFAEVIWTSDDETVFGDAADKRDTWVGQNITKVSYTISYTAVQNSELSKA